MKNGYLTIILITGIILIMRGDALHDDAVMYTGVAFVFIPMLIDFWYKKENS